MSHSLQKSHVRTGASASNSGLLGCLSEIVGKEHLLVDPEPLSKTGTSYFGSEVRKRAETAAFADVVRGAGGADSLYREIYDDYEQRSSFEARLVKAADVIDLLVQVLALERAGARGLEELWGVVEATDFDLEGPAQEILNELFGELLAARRDI